jgi:hypothetical protein
MTPLSATDAPTHERSNSVGQSTLDRFIGRVRPTLADQNAPTKARVRLLWGAANAARGLAASDVLRDAFMALAIEVRLIDRRGFWVPTDVRDTVRRHGAADIAHAIDWALKGRNPFETRNG